MDGQQGMKLGDAYLLELPQDISAPNYDRAALKPGIVHIGLGNFHRAHQAWYLHRLMQAGVAKEWAIIGAGVRPNDAVMRDKLLSQDCLTTLIELDPNGTSAEVIGSMIDFVPVELDNASLIRTMSEPAIRIVSLTVTEGGYYQDPVSGAFDATHEDIQHDVANPARPRTAFGAIVAALGARRAAGNGPFTMQSCDNLLGNGAILRATVCGTARLIDPDLADWIEAEASFPNSMVDCIVPATGEKEYSLAKSLGINDVAPVTHENFRQWVIEDDFCAGRPDWDKVGATFTRDVHAFEMMKLRLLNAGHQMLANIGEVLSVETISGCMEHKHIAGLFERVLKTEVAPLVVPVPGMPAETYIDLISGRFANPKIFDTTRRVAFDGSSRHTGFVVPTIREAVAANTPVEGLALVEALWARMCAGTREDGSVIAPNDPFWDDLHKVALAAKDDPAAWLGQTHLYGDLAEDETFRKAFCTWLTKLWTVGAVATVDAYLA
ncbi:MAG: mannitol dehydrogenase family protein [Pseudomonadota bacterium]